MHFRVRPTSASSGQSSGTSSVSVAIDRVALRMLLFPAAYIFNTLFITIYRLSTMDGNKFHDSFPGNWRVLTAGSCLFALSGFCDTLLYGALRGIIPRDIVSGAHDKDAFAVSSPTVVSFGSLEVDIFLHQQLTLSMQTALAHQERKRAFRCSSPLRRRPTQNHFCCTSGSMKVADQFGILRFP
jgi:hypothetical protein